MIYFKTIKQFNCSLDFNLTNLLTVWVMSSSNAFLDVIFFFFFFFFFPFYWRFDGIDVESTSKYVAGKHRTLTTMNISGSRVIVIVLCLLPPSVWHLSFISKSSQNWRQDVFQMWKLYRWMRIPFWLLSISEVIRILIIRLTNGKPCRCYNTCGYMIFMTRVISLNNLTVMW